MEGEKREKDNEIKRKREERRGRESVAMRERDNGRREREKKAVKESMEREQKEDGREGAREGRES